MLFDGVCNLCNGSVRFILRHERAPVILFAAMQSETGQNRLNMLGLPPESFESFLLIQGGTVLSKSRAALAIVPYLKWPWLVLLVFKVLPHQATDFLYDLVARNRYRLFGKRDVCIVPSPDVAGRFLA